MQDVPEVLSRRIKEVRRRRDWTQRGLVEKLEEIGVSMDPATLARIETGERGVKVHELFALAAALEVSPFQLLVPLDGQAEVQLTPELSATSAQVRDWLRAYRPLPGFPIEPMLGERGDDDVTPVPRGPVGEQLAAIQDRMAEMMTDLQKLAGNEEDGDA